MKSPSQRAVRHTLAGMTGGGEAVDRLMPEVYDELRRVAASFLRHERIGHSLQPTALVNEAYVRLARVSGDRWESRAHVLAIAAASIRQILTDHARRRRRLKRGGQWRRVTLDTGLAGDGGDAGTAVDVLALDEALGRLAALSPRQARVVELRFFGGLGVEETAEALSVSPRTVKGDWRVARAWLRRELAGEPAP